MFDRERSLLPRLLPASLRALSVLALATIATIGSAQEGDFVTFESGHVRPLALSPSGDWLYALNTPDARLEVFSTRGEGETPLLHVGETPVGLEPVALALRGEAEVWVVNHVSDSVSIVDVSDPRRPFVRDTLQVGDEPRDIVIAGSNDERAFVTSAHRGQNHPDDPELQTPGVGRADVWVFEVATRERVEILSLFADTPRALARSADGARVYAAAFHSGNRSSVVTQVATSSSAQINAVIGDGFRAPGPPGPRRSADNRPAPEVGVIVHQDSESGEWSDAEGRDWTPRMRFDLPDLDVFEIDADANPPRELRAFPGVGTILFNLAVHPTTGDIYCSNLESKNQTIFEPEINGHIAESQVSIIDEDTGATELVHLNPHIDYGSPAGPDEERAASLAFPLDLVFSPDGEELWVTAFGSGLVARLDASGQVLDRVPVGGGPSGLALDAARQRLYVMNRFDHSISVLSTGDEPRELASSSLRFNPEPEKVQRGRPLLYDARNSGHGDSACASCHVFADFDSLAWNLGDPEGRSERNPIPRVRVQSGPLSPFHPIKGPMTTQSLRGMRGAGAMHWRGDRNGVSAGFEDPDPFDEGQAFLHFRGAFEGLLGMPEPLPMASMEAFRDFILEVQYPPNPIAELDGSLRPAERRGEQIFESSGSRIGLGGDGDRCADCHALPLGTDGRVSFEAEPQEFKVSHLRNLYQKVGMFGNPVPIIEREPVIFEDTPTAHLGDQVRGTGFLHDGSVATLRDFFRVVFMTGGDLFPPFTFPDQPGRTGLAKVSDLVDFLFTFDTGLAPVVGQQVSLSEGSSEAERARYELLVSRAREAECDLVVHGRDGSGEATSRLLDGEAWQIAREGERIALASLEDELAAGAVLTFTAVPPGSGRRMALDRDRDEHLDGDERAAGSDPADPASVPGGDARFLRGNCNGDDRLDLSDAVFILGRLFQGTGEPGCREACDANADLAFDISDAIHALNYLFLGGPPPGAAPDCEVSRGDCEVPNCAD